MKAQAAFEYMAIFIIVLSFVIPVWFYLLTVQQNSVDDLYYAYASTAVDKIAQTADLVYSQGSPAKLRLRVYIPKNVVESLINDKIVGLKLRIKSQETYVTAASTATLTGSVPSNEGLYWIVIEAMNDHVQISAE